MGAERGQALIIVNWLCLSRVFSGINSLRIIHNYLGFESLMMFLNVSVVRHIWGNVLLEVALCYQRVVLGVKLNIVFSFSWPRFTFGSL